MSLAAFASVVRVPELVARLTPEQLVQVVDVNKLLDLLSPSGTLREIADTNDDLDKCLGQIDAEEQALAHARNPSIVSRLEDDLARCAPALSDAAVPLEAWLIPLLSALAGPAAPFLSFGLSVACKVALAVFSAWARKRLSGGAA